ncbi:MAG: heavy-metal-associated domain-containing protein [Rhizobiales bacterium]|nr:heavy-metal-associated domain-containing protein [Hyphomicrobiales bacterium]
MMKYGSDPQRPVHARRTLLVLAGLAAVLGMPGHLRAAGEAPAAQSAVALKVVSIPVEGMSCVACAAAVKRAIRAIDGVAAVEVMLARGSVRVTYMPGRVLPDRIAAAIDALGYKAGTPAESQ